MGQNKAKMLFLAYGILFVLYRTDENNHWHSEEGSFRTDLLDRSFDRHLSY